MSEKVLRTILNKLNILTASLSKVGQPFNNRVTRSIDLQQFVTTLRDELLKPFRQSIRKGATDKVTQTYTNLFNGGLLDATDFVFRTLTFNKVRVLYIANN